MKKIYTTDPFSFTGKTGRSVNSYLGNGSTNYKNDKTGGVINILFCLLCLMAGLWPGERLSGQTLIQIGTGTTGPSVGLNPSNGANGASPYGAAGGSTTGKKLQIIYTATQINDAMTAAGYGGGSSFISTVAWDISSSLVSSGNTPSHNGYTIRMANVAQSQFATTGSSYTGAMTTVWGPTNQVYPAGTGYLVTHTLASPFQWDGTSNLLVEVCYTITVTALSTYGGCRRTATSDNQMIYNGGASINCATSSYNVVVAAIPNMRLTVTSATPCSGSPAVATAGSASVCPGTSTNIGLTGLVGASGYSYLWKYSATSGGPYTPASGVNTNSTYTTPATLPSIPAYYICEVTCDNSSQMTPSNEGTVTLNNFFNCYCTPASNVAHPAGTTMIANVHLPGNTVTINNPTGQLTTAPHYAQYLTPVADLSVNNNYTITLTFGPTSGATHNNAAVWIDYNQNGVFETPSERVGFVSQVSGAQQPQAINFTVPGGALPGTTGMRVRYRYLNEANGGNTIDPCAQPSGAGTTGGANETEDYRVQIISGCAAPGTGASSSSASPVSTTSATLSWTNGNGTGGRVVVLRQGSPVNSGPVPGNAYNADAVFGSGDELGTGNFVVYNGTGNTVNITGGLTLNTTYHYSIYEYHTAGICYTTTGHTGSFTTSNGPMTYISSTTETSSTATVLPGSANNHVIRIAVNTGNGTSPPLTLTSLTINTNGTTNVSSLTAAKIFYTGNSTAFSTASQFGATITAFPGGSTPIVVNGTQTLNPGINYFWLSYDIASAPIATIGGVVDAQCTSLTVGVPQIPAVTSPSGSRTIMFNYCIPSPGSTQTRHRLTAVSFSGTESTFNYSNSPGANTPEYEYNSYTGNVNQGETYSLSVTRGVSGLNEGSYVYVWVDWDLSGAFGDAPNNPLENIMQQSWLPGGGGNTATVSVTIPPSVTPGMYRMRVWVTWDGSWNLPNPCLIGTGGIFGTEFGQIKDFDLNVVADGPIVWDGSAGTDWHTEANWTPETIPSASSVVQIPNVANKPVISAPDNGAVKDIEFSTGATLTIASGQSLSVKGNWTGNTTQVLGAGRVIFDGGSAQQITGANSWPNLRIHNTAGVTVASGQQTVNRALELSTGTFTTNNNLVIRATGLVSGHIDNFTSPFNGQLAGGEQVTFRRVFTGSNGYRYMSSPIESSLNVTDFGGFVNGVDNFRFIPGNTPAANFPTCWIFDETWPHNDNAQKGWYSQTSSGHTIEAGRGYALLMPGNYTVSLNGQPASGNKPIGVTNNYSGFNLLGNPFLASVDWQDLRNDNTSVIGNTVQFFQATGTYAGQYRSYTYNGVSGFGSDLGGGEFVTNIIPPAQAMFVQATGDGTFTFNQSARVAESETRFFGSGDAPRLLRLKISGGTGNDESLLSFGVGKDEFDQQEDAVKMYGTLPGLPNIYTISGSKNLLVNEMSAVSGDREIPVGVIITTSGSYTLSFDGLESFDQTQLFYLEDRQTGTFTNLRRQNQVVMSLPAGTFNSRFFLHATPALQVTGTNESCRQNDASVSISNPSSDPWDAELRTLHPDVMVATTQAIAGEYIFSGLNGGDYRLLLRKTDGYSVQVSIPLVPGMDMNAAFSVTGGPVDVGVPVQFTANYLGNDVTYHWDFGDGSTISGEASPVYSYSEPGIYIVQLLISNGECSGVTSHTLTVQGKEIITGMKEAESSRFFTLFPNPAGDMVSIRLKDHKGEQPEWIEVQDAASRVISRELVKGMIVDGNISLPVSHLRNGAYRLVVATRENRYTAGFTIIR